MQTWVSQRLFLFYLNRLELDNQNKLTCKKPQKTLFAFDNSFYFIYMLYIIYKLYILFYSLNVFFKCSIFIYLNVFSIITPVVSVT